MKTKLIMATTTVAMGIGISYYFFKENTENHHIKSEQTTIEKKISSKSQQENKKNNTQTHDLPGKSQVHAAHNEQKKRTDAKVPELNDSTKTEPLYTYNGIEARTEKEKQILLGLERFDSALNKIDAGDLQKEQEKIKEYKRKFTEMKLPEPKKERITDENGNQWDKLNYESGEVRYMFPEENLVKEEKQEKKAEQISR